MTKNLLIMAKKFMIGFETFLLMAKNLLIGKNLMFMKKKIVD